MTPITIICKNGHTFITKPISHLYSCSGCPVCNSEKRSSGERKVRLFLKSNNIPYVEQKTFPDCRYKSLLFFDFYLPQENVCIEYQGRQHYEVSDKWGGEEDFKVRQIRDEIKRKYCKQHNIELIEIKEGDLINMKLNRFIKRGEA